MLINLSEVFTLEGKEKTSRQHRSQPAHLLLSQGSERVSVIANRSNRMLIQMRKHLCKQACSPFFHRDRRTAELYLELFYKS